MEIKKLCWPTQLNVRCNQLATKQLKQQTEVEEDVMFVEETVVSLIAQGETVRHHIPAQNRVSCGR